MKGWKLAEPFSVKETELSENDSLIKVKTTKSLVTLNDVLRFSGEIPSLNVVLGSYGIGVVSKTDDDNSSIEKGARVYVESYKPCGKCYNCLSDNADCCSDFLIAGEDYDGFLSDFIKSPADKLFPLPDSVSDDEALFIGHVSLAVSIVDKLGIEKGDYVAIVGSNNYANILAQLVIYYQAVPILLGVNENELSAAKNAGIYYVLGEEDNWQKEVSTITGGRMAKYVVYFSDDDIPVIKAFGISSYGANVAFTGVSYKNNPISFSQAIKKQLNISCINESAGNTETSINLLANKAVNLSVLKVNKCEYDDIPNVLDKMAKQLESTGSFSETIVEIKD